MNRVERIVSETTVRWRWRPRRPWRAECTVMIDGNEYAVTIDRWSRREALRLMERFTTEFVKWMEPADALRRMTGGKRT